MNISFIYTDKISDKRKGRQKMENRNECVIRLNNGTEMPGLGFGVFRITDEKDQGSRSMQF